MLDAEHLHLTLLYVGNIVQIQKELEEAGAPWSDVFSQSLMERIEPILGRAPRGEITIGSADVLSFDGDEFGVLLVYPTDELMEARSQAWSALLGAVRSSGHSNPEKFVRTSPTIAMPSPVWRPHITLTRDRMLAAGIGDVSGKNVVLGALKLH
ncbi:hypothetical protein [Microbacterium hominis]|uniref:hypothetical protein n=1 Tax=Microbacterium hominis TaxID=162426 RepID=UPI0012E04A14|nr:hypothetical protein [Microbacterium hominis]